MVLVKKCPFFHLFLANIGQENVFYDILEQKTAVLGSKNKKSKHQKNRIFSKGLTHAFNPKMPFFPSIVLEKTDQENVFYDNLRKKKPF